MGKDGAGNGSGLRGRGQKMKDKEREKEEAAPFSQFPSPALSRFAQFVLRPSSFVFLFFIALYSLTLAPGLLPADAGEYQVVGAVLGVAHPPGYALYTLASWLISRLPSVAPATAINFLSAVLAAGALALLCRAVRGLMGSAL